VKSNFRTAITIPERSWSRFRDIFTEMCDKMDSQQSSAPATTAGESSSTPTEQPDAAKED
uniref:Uncharacterized protein n=1 Tax=Plectus sambesii TaxID=2011161 RepID=A0A914VBJ2_9BILA